MTGSFSIDWTAYAKARKRANALNKKTVFAALADAGITHVCSNFDGEGDQGQIDQPTAQANGKTVEFPLVKLVIHEAHYGSGETTVSEMDLPAAIEQLCYGCLELRHDGWEINDGSYGEFAFDVAARKISLDFYGRITDTAHSRHTF